MRVILPALLLFCFLAVSCKEKNVNKKVAKKIEVQDDAVCACGNAPPPPPPPEYVESTSLTVKGSKKEYRVIATLTFEGVLDIGDTTVWAYKLSAFTKYDRQEKLFVVAPSEFPKDEVRARIDTFSESILIEDMRAVEYNAEPSGKTLFYITANSENGYVTISQNGNRSVRNRY